MQRSGTIANDDYPAAAIRAGEEGTVRIRMDIDVLGRVTNCAVASSSGSATLDSASCALAIRRFRFSPALDRRGRPVPSVATRAIRWQLPDGPPPLPPINGWVALSLPAQTPAVPPAQCGRWISISLLDATAQDLCAELLAPDQTVSARPARRALLTFAGGIGAAPPAPPPSGRLVYREQAQFGVAADGSVVGCSTAVSLSTWRERHFDLCRFLQTTDAPYFAAGFPMSQGRVALEVYE
jgi:TonB family protein